MVIQRAGWVGALSIVVVSLAGLAVAQSQIKRLRTHNTDPKQTESAVHREVPDDPWMPRPKVPPPGVVAGGGPVVRGPFTSIQNVNGTPDACEIESGNSPDCDGNSIPDECEQAADGATVYEPGFIWDWRVDFGKPINVFDLPSNPNGDKSSRNLSKNRCLSRGPSLENVWTYGKGNRIELVEKRFTPDDFTIFDVPHAHEGGAVWDDASSADFNWDLIGWIPVLAHFFHPDYFQEDTAAVLRFTYPGTVPAAVRVAGVIRDINDGCGNGIDWFIVRNEAKFGLLDSGAFENGESSTIEGITAHLVPGDALFFAVGKGPTGSEVCDWTAVDLTIEVQTSPDCNGNGIPDGCDLGCWTSGGPCDLPGCGGGEDCNSNAIPDDCELDGNDCNENDVPDDCETDCNENSIPDSCDLTTGVLEDINGNAIPDTCELVVDRVKPCGRIFLLPNSPFTSDIDDSVHLFDRSGSPIGVFLEGQVHRTAGVAFDHSGNLLISQAEYDNLLLMSRDGQLHQTISGGGLNGPHGPSVDGEGNFAVGSWFTDSLKFFSLDGSYIRDVRHAGTEDPRGVVFDRSGNMFVASRNNGNGRVSVFDSAGNFVRYIGQGLLVPHPISLAFDSSENLYATMPGRILKFAHDGTLINTISHPDLEPMGIALDEEERLFVTNDKAHEIFVFDENGILLERFPVDMGPNQPSNLGLWSIAFDVFPERDCNSNGTSDACDVESGSSNDCNFNGVPDECELDNNDCNNNAIPDDCEPDCNDNGLPDACDLADGPSEDCDENGIPDECQLLNAAGLGFDGVDDWVRVPRAPVLEPTEELTIEAWVRPDNRGSYHSRIVRMAAPFAAGYFLVWSQGGSYRLMFALNGGDGGNCWATDTVPTSTYFDQWIHVAGVYSAKGSYCRLYVNGVLKAEQNGVGRLHYSGSDLIIGNHTDNNEDFDGLIDDVRIWSVARTQEEILTTMSVPLIGNSSGLVGYWRFDEGAGQIASDSSPFGNHGVLGENDDLSGDGRDPVWVTPGAPTTEADCNANGTLDECDLASGFSTDCNDNGMPDECEPDEDCNDNDIQDICDLASGASRDCNVSAVPDECELVNNDCNKNGVPDDCEDCNDNGLADSCDIAAGTSNDCNANGIADECEPDCNDNDVADACDITDETSFDFDLNGVPDECDPDCNDNGLPDFIDIAFGLSLDCNENNVPDDCDVRDRTSPDCNSNIVPDECDVRDHTSKNCDGDAVPDECEPDFDNDGIPNDCDAKGDFDHDADIDLDDYASLWLCLDLSGPDVSPPFFECLDAFDVNASGTIDMRDAAAFQASFDP